MKREFEGGRWVAELRPSGFGRYVVAAFLSFWICGWAVGEYFAGSTLLAMLGLWPGKPALPPPPGAAAAVMLGFLALWLTFWTLGGLVAITEVLRAFLGVDRIEWDGAGLLGKSGIGPLGRARWHPREEIRDIVVTAPRGTLTLRTRGGSVTLTRWGSATERAALRQEIAAALGLPGTAPAELPAGWETEVLPDGAVTLRQRTPAWVRSFHGDDFVLARGKAERRRRFFGRRTLREFVPAHILLEHGSDSDGDDWYALVLRGSAGKATVARAIHDGYDLLRLGRWIASKLQTDLRVPPHMKDPERAA